MTENYPNSKMHWNRWGSHECLDVPCSVSIATGVISISYTIDDVPYKYVGTEYGEGHFLLTEPSVEGRSSLHRAAASVSATPDRPARVLEGSWIESQGSGMWRITLL